MYVFEKLLKYEFQNNYAYLLTVSQNITQRNRKVDQKFNLLHEVYVWLHKQLPKHHLYLRSETDFRKWVTKYLKQLYEYAKKMKHTRKKDNFLFTFQPTEDEVISVGNYYDQTDTKAEQLIYIEAENTNYITKLFLQDMLLNDIPIDRGFMVNRIKDVAKTFLNDVDYQIFDLYYLQDLNCSEIYNELKKHSDDYLGYHAILEKQKEIKIKITEQLKW